MQKYEVTKVVGEGAFGRVLLGHNKTTQAKVAIKHIKRDFRSWEEALAERELKSLKKLKGHNRIVGLQELIMQNKQLYFVFDFVDSNLLNVISARRTSFSVGHVKTIMRELLEGLAHMHKNGFFHRDIKPENLLCDMDGSRLRLADFGLAREIRSRPPYTDYVSTRWYRAPECILRSSTYSSPIDVWACGCILAELYTLKPTFPGNSMQDMIYRISRVCGVPTQGSWAEGMKLAAHMNFKFVHAEKTPLHTIVPAASREAASVIDSMLSWDWRRRPTTAACLRHPFFTRSEEDEQRLEREQAEFQQQRQQEQQQRQKQEQEQRQRQHMEQQQKQREQQQQRQRQEEQRERLEHEKKQRQQEEHQQHEQKQRQQEEHEQQGDQQRLRDEQHKQREREQQLRIQQRCQQQQADPHLQQQQHAGGTHRPAVELEHRHLLGQLVPADQWHKAVAYSEKSTPYPEKSTSASTTMDDALGAITGISSSVTPLEIGTLAAVLRSDQLWRYAQLVRRTSTAGDFVFAVEGNGVEKVFTASEALTYVRVWIAAVPECGEVEEGQGIVMGEKEKAVEEDWLHEKEKKRPDIVGSERRACEDAHRAGIGGKENVQQQDASSTQAQKQVAPPRPAADRQRADEIAFLKRGEGCEDAHQDILFQRVADEGFANKDSTGSDRVDGSDASDSALDAVAQKHSTIPNFKELLGAHAAKEEARLKQEELEAENERVKEEMAQELAAQERKAARRARRARKEAEAGDGDHGRSTAAKRRSKREHRVKSGKECGIEPTVASEGENGLLPEARRKNRKGTTEKKTEATTGRSRKKSSGAKDGKKDARKREGRRRSKSKGKEGNAGGGECSGAADGADDTMAIKDRWDTVLDEDRRDTVLDDGGGVEDRQEKSAENDLSQAVSPSACQQGAVNAGGVHASAHGADNGDGTLSGMQEAATISIDASTEQVCAWLGSIGTVYAKYAGAFAESAIDGATLLADDFCHVDLVELGVEVGIHRKRIMKEVQRMQARQPPKQTTGRASPPTVGGGHLSEGGVDGIDNIDGIADVDGIENSNVIDNTGTAVDIDSIAVVDIDGIGDADDDGIDNAVVDDVATANAADIDGIDIAVVDGIADDNGITVLGASGLLDEESFIFTEEPLERCVRLSGCESTS
jgi:serine/threonine protein kinase